MKRPTDKKVTGAFLGTIVEYYDYSLYGFSAGILAEKFFPGEDKVAGLMHVFAIYALSYLAKPLGSVFFSRMGDKYGRRNTLRITILGIAVPTLTIGILPDYETLGALTTQILVLCRFLQGFFAAGEYDGAAIYVIEHLGRKQHYTASAFTRATGVAGLLLGIAATNFCNSSIFPPWGWRIPFLLSLPLALLTIHYRRFLEETPDFIEAKKESIEFLDIYGFFRKNLRCLMLVVFLAGGFGVTYQVSVIFMKQYLTIVIPGASNVITSFSIVIVLFFGITMPIAGLLADRFGHKIILQISAILAISGCMGLTAAINLELLNLALGSSLIIAIAVAPFNALAHGIIVEAFSAKERYRGVGLGHALGSLLMSGTANYICLFFMKKYDMKLFPVIYISAFTLLSYFCIRMFDRALLSKKL